MRKTSKADLVHQLEQNVSIIQTLPIFDISRTTLIRDDMPLLQSINAKMLRTLPYWFCALCHRRETIMLESDQLEKTEPFQQ
jgi:hypothetical protein